MDKSITDYINENLNGEAKQAALEFVDFLCSKDLSFFKDDCDCWKDKIYYWVKFRDECVCFIAVCDPDEPQNLWTVWSDESKLYEDYIVDDDTRQTAWKYIDHCGNCGSCGGGKPKKVFGRTFERVCGCTFRIDNPTSADLPFLNKMVEIKIAEYEYRHRPLSKKCDDRRNISIRLGKPDDAERFAAIHARSWSFAYGGCVPESVLAERNARWPMIWQKMLANNLNSQYVITVEETMIGFLTIGNARDTDLDATVCELVGLYLDPQYIGKGFGMQAMDWVKREATARGYKAVCLWVLSENRRAKRFYEKSGFAADGTTKPSGLGDTAEERYILILDTSEIQ